MNKEEIINRISYIRTRANLSARKLSEKILKSESYINRLEFRKDFEPTISTISDIVKACNSTLIEFFYYDIDQYKADSEIIELLKTASNKKKQAIIDILKS